MTRVIPKSNAKSDPVPTVILYGQSEIGKPRAGVFKAANVDAALKAAHLLHLSVLKADAPEILDLAGKLPTGRIQGKGQAIVPFIGGELYRQIASFTKKPTPANAQGVSAALDNGSAQPGGVSKSSSPRLPRDWDDITVSDLVIAQYPDPEDGWWQAIVVEQNENIFKLRWQKERRGRPFQRNRLTLGLIYPGKPNRSEIKSDAKTATKSAFPSDWPEIGLDHIVLAKEEGPVEQWWEAKIIAQDNDTFTLQWCECPHLPPIVRPRLALALLHPRPKAR